MTTTTSALEAAHTPYVGPLTTPVKLVREEMTESTRLFLEVIRHQLIAQREDGTYALRDGAQLREAFATIGGDEWATRALDLLDDAVTDMNRLADEARPVFVIP